MTTDGVTTEATPRRPRGRPRDPRLDDAILEATRELVAELGCAGASMSAIADRAGCGKPTIYLRWPNRAAVIQAAVDDTRADAGDDLLGALQLAAEAVHDLVVNHPDGRFLAEALVMPRGWSS